MLTYHSYTGTSLKPIRITRLNHQCVSSSRVVILWHDARSARSVLNHLSLAVKQSISFGRFARTQAMDKLTPKQSLPSEKTGYSAVLTFCVVEPCSDTLKFYFGENSWLFLSKHCAFWHHIIDIEIEHKKTGGLLIVFWIISFVLNRLKHSDVESTWLCLLTFVDD